MTKARPEHGGPSPADLAHIGAQLRTRREAKKHTLRSLGKLSGVSFQTIGRIELGREFFSLANLWQIALALGAEPGELLQRAKQK